MPPSPGLNRSIVSRKASVGAHLLLQKLLPKKSLQMASSLSDEDKEVLAYLVAFGQHVSAAPPSSSKLPWRRWKSPSSKTSKQQHALPAPDACAAAVHSRKHSLLLTCHYPTFSCDCFACYASFWSRWDASFNRDIINQVLDEVEICPETIKGKKKNKKKQQQDQRKLTPQDGGGGIEDHGGPHDHYVQLTEDAYPCRCVNHSMQGAFTDALNKVAISSVEFVDDAPSNDMLKEEAPRIVTKLMIGSIVQAGPVKDMCRVRYLSEEASVSTSLNDNKSARSARERNTAPLLSGVMGEVFCRAPNVEDRGDLTTMQASEAMAVGLSLVCMEGKTSPRLQQHHWTGKRKSNQILPLDFDDSSPCKSTVEAAVGNEDMQAPMVARVADLDLGGRGFLARIFPDALGRVASQLWDLVSVRLRSRTMEYH